MQAFVDSTIVSLYTSNMKKNGTSKGFTLIELILVLGLLATMGALAAPQFTAVFDNGRNEADIAQMDQLMVAFQLEQAPFFETHEGEFDLLKAENITVGRDAKGNLTTSVDVNRAVQTLQDFLDVVVDPNHEAFMKDLKCLTTDRSGGENGSIFRAKLIGNSSLQIVCDGDSNASSIQLKIPGTDTISYAYTEDEPEEGTWMIVGDDDRLRADYVKSMMHIQEADAKQQLIQSDRGKKYYRYRTTFSVDHQQNSSQAQVGTGEFWKLFTHDNISGTQKVGLDMDALPEDAAVEFRYRYMQGHKWKGNPYDYDELDQLKILNVAEGHTKNEAIIEFRSDVIGGDSFYCKYGVQVFQKKDLPVTPRPNLNNEDSGWIQTGKNHWFYYELLEGNPSTGSAGGSSETSEDFGFSYHAGAVFNYVNDNNYDYLSFEENRNGEMVLRSYRVQGGTASNYKTEAVLSGFEFNEVYTMDIHVEKGKAIVNLSDGLLKKDVVFSTDSNDLHPAIGYYMNQTVDLGKENARASQDSSLPLIKYADSQETGPRFLLVEMPEFYPYQTESQTKPEEQKKPNAPSLRRTGIETLTMNPVAYQITTDAEQNYAMTLRLPNGSTQTITSRTKDFSVSQSGTIEAFISVNGVKSDTVQVVVDNIIDPFAEIEGNYVVGSEETTFRLSNFDEVIQEMEPYQKREKLKLIMETKGKKKEVKKASFTLKNEEFDLDDFAIYVESEYGEVLSPLAEVSQPLPPEVNINQSAYYGYAVVTMNTDTGDEIYYRLLDEDQDPMGNWQRYHGSFEERFSYVEVVTRARSGTESKSVIVENPYANTIVQAPTFEPGENGKVQVRSKEGTFIYYWNGDYWDSNYYDGNYWDSNQWLSTGSNRVTFDLAEGETLVVYAKSAFGTQESENVSYTREADSNEKPAPPIIEKPYHNRNRIQISGTNYDEICYQYTYMQNKNKQRTTDWIRSDRDVSFDSNGVVSVSAFAVKNGIESETVTWNQ